MAQRIARRCRCGDARAVANMPLRQLAFVVLTLAEPLFELDLDIVDWTGG